MKVKSRDAFATSVAATHDGSIDLDKPIFTLSVASEILEVHPRTLMMYEHLSMISPKRTALHGWIVEARSRRAAHLVPVQEQRRAAARTNGLGDGCRRQTEQDAVEGRPAEPPHRPFRLRGDQPGRQNTAGS